MNILLTNDDGILAYGLEVLINRFKGRYNLWVIAPKNDRSRSSHSINSIEGVEVSITVISGLMSSTTL